MAKKQPTTHIVNRDLPCKLSDEDKAKLSDEQARTEIQIEVIKGRVTDLNTEKRALEGHRNKLAHEVEDGAQERSVVCHWVEDLPHGVKRLVRQDTKDVVEEETLTGDDLQETMPGTDGDVTPIDKNKGKGKGGKGTKGK